MYHSYIFIFIFLSEVLLAQNTLPQAPKRKPTDPSRLSPEAIVPHPIDQYSFSVTGTWQGTEYYTDKVPVYELKDKLTPGSDIAVGEQINPEYIRNVAGRIFYGWQKTDDQGLKKSYYIDGRFLTLKSK